jgi:ribosome biogenesis protein MAK21
MNKQVIHEAKNENEQTHISTFADRFYRTLYELILKVHMSKANQLDDYFSIIFKAVKADESVPRCLAFIKRLL